MYYYQKAPHNSYYIIVYCNGDLLTISMINYLSPQSMFNLAIIYTVATASNVIW